MLYLVICQPYISVAETNAQLDTIVVETVEAAKEVAQQTGISKEVAVTQVVAGAMDAAKEVGDEPLTEVKSSLPEETVSPVMAQMEPDTEEKDSERSAIVKLLLVESSAARISNLVQPTVCFSTCRSAVITCGSHCLPDPCLMVSCACFSVIASL